MNTATAKAAPDVEELKEIKKAPIMISLVIGAFFAILNETLLNVAFYDLMQELQVSSTTVQWLSTGFMLTVGILVPVSALLIQWFTTRQMFLGAMTLFFAGTLISGIAPNFPVLLAGRIIQACGTGLLLPIMMNTILVLFPPEKRGGAMGTIGLVIMFAPALGPTLSGLILDVLHWRWLFFVVLPFAAFSILFAAVYLKNVTEVTRPKVDVISVLLSTVGFGGVVFGFSTVGEADGGWSEPKVFLSIGAGVISLALFVWRQLKVREPIMDMRAFRSPMFSLTAVLMVIMMMSLFSTMIIIPMFLQGVLLLSAFVSGLALLPGGLVNGFMSPIMGRLFDRFGPRWLIIPGTLLIVAVMWMFMRVSSATTVQSFVLLHVLLMVGIAMVMMPGQTNGLNQLPRKYYPHGTAILNTLSQVAGAVGVALFMSIMSAGQTGLEGTQGQEGAVPQAEGLAAGVQNAFAVGLAFAVIAFVLALFIRRTSPPDEEHAPVHQP